MAEDKDPAKAERLTWTGDDFAVYPPDEPLPPPSEDEEVDENDD